MNYNTEFGSAEITGKSAAVQISLCSNIATTTEELRRIMIRYLFVGPAQWWHQAEKPTRKLLRLLTAAKKLGLVYPPATTIELVLDNDVNEKFYDRVSYHIRDVMGALATLIAMVKISTQQVEITFAGLFEVVARCLLGQVFYPSWPTATDWDHEMRTMMKYAFRCGMKPPRTLPPKGASEQWRVCLETMLGIELAIVPGAVSHELSSRTKSIVIFD